MFNVDKQGRTPIYEQLISSIEKNILHGIIKESEQIPSVRSLSTELSINPNTIQKAYNELEKREITYSVPGVGRFVSKNALAILKSDTREYFETLRIIFTDLKLIGVNQSVISDILNDIYKQ